jgi:hypothetical protein
VTINLIKSCSLKEMRYQGMKFSSERSRVRPEYLLDPIYPLFWSLDTERLR